jgi:transcriptional regulator with XRE-family HTH domain
MSWYKIPRTGFGMRKSKRFAAAFNAARTALGLSQREIGLRLGVARRTLTRWEIDGDLPPLGQRKHIATSFADAPAEVRAALVASLELDEAFVLSLAVPERERAPAGHDLNGALLAICEQLDVSPGRVRAALLDFLGRLDAMGLSVQAVRASLSQGSPRPPRAAARRTRAT